MKMRITILCIKNSSFITSATVTGQGSAVSFCQLQKEFKISFHGLEKCSGVELPLLRWPVSYLNVIISRFYD